MSQWLLFNTRTSTAFTATMSGGGMALAVILAVTFWSSEAAPQGLELVPLEKDYQQDIFEIPSEEFEIPNETIEVLSIRSPTPSSPLPVVDDKNDIKFETLYYSLDKFNIIDIRRKDELTQLGMIPGSNNLPLQEIEDALDLSEEAFKAKYGFPKLSPDDDTIVLTCRSGRRVRVADQILRSRGFTKQRIYYGSFLDWVMRGGPVVRLASN
ncbi:uncharacterized protein [Palaemon carinicauda]|uniref:uncharacterized protein n=1 Tax=Palaemon carinicauda TaxID=392227 RepID=UPI0035B64B9F